MRVHLRVLGPPRGQNEQKTQGARKELTAEKELATADRGALPPLLLMQSASEQDAGSRSFWNYRRANRIVVEGREYKEGGSKLGGPFPSSQVSGTPGSGGHGPSPAGLLLKHAPLSASPRARVHG